MRLPAQELEAQDCRPFLPYFQDTEPAVYYDSDPPTPEGHDAHKKPYTVHRAADENALKDKHVRAPVIPAALIKEQHKGNSCTGYQCYLQIVTRNLKRL